MECDNTRHSTSYKDITGLRNKKLLKPVDYEILRAIYKFKYINKHNVSTYIKNNLSLSTAIRESNIENRFSFLTKNGILLRHYFYWQNDNILERTPNIYTISKGGLAFLKKMDRLTLNIDKYLILESPELIFKKLAFNQLAINYISKISAITDYKLEVPLKSLNYKTTFTLYGLFYIDYKEQTIPLVIEPVRKIINWKHELNNRLTLIKDYIVFSTTSKKGVFDVPPIIILLCEDDTHIKEVHEELLEKSFPSLYVLYTTDIRQMESNLSSSLMSYKKVDDHWELIRHNIDFLN